MSIRNYETGKEMAQRTDPTRAMRGGEELQHIHRPSSSGIQYDPRIPDDVVVSSPGGVDSNHHHWTKGFYGSGGASNDIYGFDPPRYPSGEYGNLYHKGPMAAQVYYPKDADGPYRRLWDGKSPDVPSNQISAAESEYSLVMPDPTFTPPKLNSVQGGNGGVEPGLLIEGFDGSTKTKKSKYSFENAALVFAIIVLAGIAASFWIQSGTTYLREKFHKGKEMSSKELAVYAVAVTAILIIIFWLTGESFSVVERA